MFKLITAVVLMVALSGCAVLEQVEESPMTAQLVTSQLTLRFIAADDDPVERAARMRGAVAKLQAIVDGGPEFTLAEFQELALREFDFESLSLAEQDLVIYGLNLARKLISDLIGEGVVGADERYTLSTVLTWVDQAAARVR
ncbi:hypothetical protein MYE70_10595 [Marinobacter alexandrii]|uniref:hypothetical protein n=1 Tax=Marinobacter alexandrii TaxID=2570351 RepID=UPI001FFFD636|nr:hypothetical protein [Marinobacter alexandrii]MCK2149514.1 hypothetical protein [Marinobacter alexandrii]